MKKENVFVLCLLTLFVGMIYGVVAHAAKLFPYDYLDKVHIVSSSVASALNIDKYNNEIRWVKKARSQTGMVLQNTQGFGAHYLAYSTTHDTNIRIVDSKGDIVHEWVIPFNDIWPEQEQVIALKHLDNFYFYARDFHIYENGDILVMLSAGGITPWGMGLVRLDKNSNVVWKYAGYVNNDFEIGPNGEIYVIEHQIREDGIQAIEYDILPFLEDNITILSPETGDVQGSFSLIDAIDNSQYANLLRGFVDNTDGDPTHSNSIHYVERDHPSIEWIKEGYLLVSVRNLNALVVIDPQTQNVVHAFGLMTRMQHDIDYLGNGNFMIFDNRGNFKSGGYSRVIEFEPDTQEVLWDYQGSIDTDEFDNEFWGLQERLDNGNTMIVNPTAGSVFEVLPSGEKVWEYVVPLSRLINDEKMVATVTMAELINKSRLNFLNNERAD